MQIEIDTEILETIFTHAARAARLAGYLDDPIAVDGTSVIDEVTKSLEKISRLVAARLGKPYGLRPEGIHSWIVSPSSTSRSRWTACASGCRESTHWPRPQSASSRRCPGAASANVVAASSSVSRTWWARPSRPCG